MVNFWSAVNNVIDKSDLLLLVMDSRMVLETRNAELEDKIRKNNKPLIFVLNKCDLVSKDDSDADKKSFKSLFNPLVFVSSKEYHGLKLLRERIIIEGKKIGVNGKIKVGVIGYPNVGKSSLINAMSGRSSAGTSSTSGFTKGVKNVNVDNKILFVDTPGVIPYNERDSIKHSVIGAVDPSKVKDPESVVFSLIKDNPGLLERYYDVSGDEEEILEKVALSKNLLIKKGLPDVRRAARFILVDWQNGLIK